MEFAWSEEQRELIDAVLEFARQTPGDDMVQRDQTSTFARDLWNRCAELGIQGLPFPEEYGGGGADPLTAVRAVEALATGCRDNGLIFGLGAQMWSVQMPIATFGSEEQKRRFLPRLCRGEWIGAHGMSEPDSGSDAFALRTTAERRGDGFVLNGVKTFVSEAPVADLFLVFATHDPHRGVLGISGFLIERDTPGLKLGRPIEKMGLRTSPMSEVILDDCRVPAENLLGREGRGASIFNDGMEWERAGLLAGAVGAMDRVVRTAAKYAKERHQFGRAIGEFQAVSHRLADMKARLEAARLLLYRATWLKQTRGSTGGEASVAKLFISEAYVATCLDAVQVLGGYGFTTEFEMERELRDAIGSRLYSGTSEVQRNLIARTLGL
jgi:hypothetical protein